MRADTLLSILDTWCGKNAIKLALRHSGQPLKVTLNYAGLQATGSVCTALVQAANTEPF